MAFDFNPSDFNDGPFGELIRSSGTAPCNFGFSTKYRDSETGLNYYGYRYYSAGLGRWLGRDPIGERGGKNLFGFVRNNPIKWIDRLGLQTSADATFGDFQGPIPPDSPYDAFTSVDVVPEAEADVTCDPSIGEANAKTKSVTLKVNFNKNNSWVRSSQTGNAALLAHERGHIKIAEEIAKKYEGIFKTLHGKHTVPCDCDKAEKEAFRQWEEQLKNTDTAAQQEMNSAQEQYDADTDHGRR